MALAVARSLEAGALAETPDDLALDDLALALAGEVGNQPKGLLSDWLGRAISVVGTRVLRTRRGHYTDAIVPFIGDVVVYQGNGQPIRNTIAQAIRNAGPEARVVLLGHSLGGIACVDLLADTAFPTVKLLVTVGSQAPLFYEMNALQKLRFGDPLPEHFPHWLHVFDPQDFLSYIGKAVFKDPRDRITDVRVDNRQPFPDSHSAYWANPRTWDVIVPRLIEVDR
ncbi:MAG TPA: hypothetical protein VEL76_29810 [Gemmataceae bacterium]|nr:hypothetical protein [Gemmataceae bacterium]